MNPSIAADTELRELALAVARNAVGPNLPIASVLAGQAITQSEYDRIKTNPTFQKYVAAYEKDLSENGFSFAAKAKVLAEHLLPEAFNLVKDKDVSGPARVKMMENLVDWAGLKPRQDAAALVAGTGFSIQIVIPSAGVAVNATQTARNRRDNGDSPLQPVIEVPATPTLAVSAPTIPGPARVSAVRFDEPEDYEYAGDDAPAV